MKKVGVSIGIGLALLVGACGSSPSTTPSDSTLPQTTGGTKATSVTEGTGGARASVTGSSTTTKSKGGTGGGTATATTGGSGLAQSGGSGTATGGSEATKSVGGSSSSSGSKTNAAGGSSSSGTTTSAPPVVKPKLVTSGRDAYWKVGTPTELTSGTADISVNEGSTYQEWTGFGGTFNEAGWEVLLLLSEAERNRALSLLFDANDGARFAYGRIPIGASDYAIERYTLNETPDDFTMEHFSIEQDRKLLIPYIKAALLVKSDLRLWASPWTPPAWMKTNNHTDKGSMKDDPDVLSAHALYLAKFVEEYAKEQLVIEAIHPQNEPTYAPAYPSCQWTPELFTRFIRDYLGPTFEQRKVPAEIWCGTMSAPEDGEHLSAVMKDADAKKHIKGIGAQWNHVDNVAKWIADYRLPVMQTEHRCGNYRWVTETYNPDKPPNDHAYAEESWGLIVSWIAAGVSSYSAWNMVLDTFGKNLNSEQPWPQNALLTVDRTAKTLQITPAYYVFRHFSQYIDPGAKRIGTSVDANQAMAFKNPDGTIVTVLYNSGDSAKKTVLGVGSAKLQFDIPAHGWATVNWK